MTCEEFKRAYNSYLDGAQSEVDARPVFAHAEGCASCSSYRDALVSLDQDLRHMPEPEIPGELLRKLEGIPSATIPAVGGIAWWPELIRILSYGIPAVIVAFLLGKLPEEHRAIGNILLAFAGTLIFFLSVFRPIFLPPPSFPRQARRSQGGDGR